jgi:hypothetical protein
MKDKGIIADGFALPFWVILLTYAFYKILHGDKTAWIIVLIIGVALIVDSSLVINYFNKKDKEIK